MKAALRATAISELGNRFDDALENSVQQASMARGGAIAIMEGVRVIGLLSQRLDKDIDDDKLDLEQAKMVKSWLDRAANAMENLSKQYENKILLAEGQVRAWKETIGITKKAYELELSKMPKDIEPTTSQSEVTNAPEGRKPKPSIKARRQSAEKNAENT